MDFGLDFRDEGALGGGEVLFAEEFEVLGWNCSAVLVELCV